MLNLLSLALANILLEADLLKGTAQGNKRKTVYKVLDAICPDWKVVNGRPRPTVQPFKFAGFYLSSNKISAPDGSVLSSTEVLKGIKEAYSNGYDELIGRYVTKSVLTQKPVQPVKTIAYNVVQIDEEGNLINNTTCKHDNDARFIARKWGNRQKLPGC